MSAPTDGTNETGTSAKSGPQGKLTPKRARNPLTGTTLRVYRVLYREGKPLGVNEVQRKMGLSSPSVAYYHLSKLVDNGLVEEKDGGYIVDRLLFENLIRIRRSLIPLQTTFVAFFSTTLVGLLTVFRPHTISDLYLLAILINCIALAIFAYQAVGTYKVSRA